MKSTASHLIFDSTAARPSKYFLLQISVSQVYKKQGTQEDLIFEDKAL